MAYVKRVLESGLLAYLHNFPVVGLTGPRQSGKSTLLQALLPNYKYLTFDDYKLQDFLQSDPEAFMATYSEHIIFDEIQKMPELFNYLKIAVDNDRMNYGKFVVTGSSQFSSIKNITESLAGRIGLLSLLPFQFSEMPTELRSLSIFKGSYPELVNRSYREASAWYSSYIDTYLNKDVRTLSNIGDLRDFQRFITLLAANTAQILNLSSYARDLGVAVNTIKRWLSILEASYIIYLLPPFYKNYNKRVVKSPKLYFYDTGLVSYLVGITTQQLYENGPMAGSLFENYLVTEILKKKNCISKVAPNFIIYARVTA